MSAIDPTQSDVIAIAQSVITAAIPIIRDYLSAFNIGLAVQKVPGTTLGSPASPVIYTAGPGTYTLPNNTTITLTENLNLLFWDKTSWTYLAVPVNINATSTTGKNLYNKGEDVNGYGIDYTTGQIVSNTNISLSKAIPVTEGSAYTLSGRSTANGTNGIIYLDANGNLIPIYVFGTSYGSTGNGTFTVPTGNGIKFVQFTSRAYEGVNTNVQLEAGVSATAYEPYGVTAIQKLQSSNIAATYLKGTYRNLNPDNIAIKVPHEYYPHEIAFGAGTEALPKFHTDGTGGISTLIGYLSNENRGGKIYISPERYQISNYIGLISGVKIQGSVWNYPNDPNGVAESGRGTKLYLTKPTGYTMGIITNGAYGGVSVKSVGFRSGKSETTATSIGASIYNPNFTPANPEYNSGLVFANCRVDQGKFVDLSFNNHSAGIVFLNSMNLDASYIESVNTDGCAVGIYIAAETFYSRVIKNVLSDCVAWGLYVNNATKAEHLFIQDNTFVRNAGITGASAWGPLCSVYLNMKGGSKITGNIWEDSGRSIAADRADVYSTANDLQLISSDNVVKDNIFLRARGSSVIVQGSRNMFDNKVYQCLGSAYEVQGDRNEFKGSITNNKSGIHVISGNNNVIDCIFDSNTDYDIKIDAGCTNTVVYGRPGINIIDNGTGTVIK